MSDVIKEVGQERRFMGMMRRLGTRSNVSTGVSSYSYGPFTPDANDDPFASAGEQPAWRVGWHWGGSVTNSMNMTLNQGWQVIFNVFDDGGSRRVTAQVQGAGMRKEVQRFVDSVFQLL
ncbi:hypothetical protein [Aeromicrobium sp. 9AM]|uniref:hypothetical protein n=1 Tax=Aeromicrobium sp. 9AM TaxID=2653126 RepID=UPI0012F39197|nr:hypothetical protein [Aeromicrobium sp. 9AM]VXB05553.1 hypothetical protein AERO9AM_10295 [Aeromicrobium sp. 9AM]